MPTIIQGVGINDADYVVRPTRKNNELSFCPFYRVWYAMMKRAYSKKYKAQNPTYSKVSLCEEWQRFSAFKEWMVKQDWQGKELDKDILVVGNKIYSPEFCVFVDKRVNSCLLIRNAGDPALPIGVYARDKKFRSCISIDGKTKNLGTFANPKDAHLAWQVAKAEQIKLVASTISDEKIQKALMARVLKINKEIELGIETSKI